MRHQTSPISCVMSKLRIGVRKRFDGKFICSNVDLNCKIQHIDDSRLMDSDWRAGWLVVWLAGWVDVKSDRISFRSFKLIVCRRALNFVSLYQMLLLLLLGNTNKIKAFSAPYLVNKNNQQTKKEASFIPSSNKEEAYFVSSLFLFCKE